MDLERVQNESLLTTSELKARELKQRLEHLRDTLRQTYPQFKAVEDLDGEAGVGLAVEFRAKQIEYQELLATIAALRKALGK